MGLVGTGVASDISAPTHQTFLGLAEHLALLFQSPKAKTVPAEDLEFLLLAQALLYRLRTVLGPFRRVAG